MKQLTFLELARRVLDEEGRPLSVEEIWEFALERGYDKLVETTGKTPTATIGSRIYIDIRDNRNSQFAKGDSRLRKLFLRSRLAEVNAINLREEETVSLPPHREFNYLERDLHSLLTYFAHFYLKAYP